MKFILDRLLTNKRPVSRRRPPLKESSYLELKFKAQIALFWIVKWVLLQEQPVLWSWMGAATSTTLRTGWTQPPKLFPGITDSNIEEANNANMLTPMTMKTGIDIELWTSLGFVSRDYIASRLLTNFVFRLISRANYESSLFVLLTLLQF